MNAPDSDKLQRRDVHFEGQVQGVGFRYTTRRIATGYAVTGFVRNLPDGRVHLVAEGTTLELDGFVAEIERVLVECIHGQRSVSAPATGEFSRFTIAH